MHLHMSFFYCNFAAKLIVHMCGAYARTCEN